MKANATNQSKVKLSATGISICGKPTLILCSSLFYFRIPRAYWRDRMQQIKNAGYNSIDVYIPWNFHELAEGEWDFEGERDISTFLQFAAEEGLWVIARPGPYICSEWDGGGLPAFLNTKPSLCLRQNNPAFLRHVSQWFDRIFPVLNHYQIDKDGTIIAIQLENELDFFDCLDHRGYMTALRDLALSHAITVPLIACSGQGDIYGATGDVPGIVPSCNIYSNEMEDGVETRIKHYVELLRHQNYPLMVTETQRQHFFLRRLLSAGAKLLGPYLQTSGTNFGFTNGINNWGTPMSFLTSDYNFGGMISPNGEPTPELYEGRLLGRLIATLGEELAQAVPKVDHELIITADCSLVEGGPFILGFPSGGQLIASPNIHSEPMFVKIGVDEGVSKKEFSLRIAPGHCPLLLKDFPLRGFQIDATLCFATAELLTIYENRIIVFYSDQEADIEFVFPTGVQVSSSDMRAIQQNNTIQLKYSGEGISKTLMQFADGNLLTIYSIDRGLASRFIGIGENDLPTFEEQLKPLIVLSAPAPKWCAIEINHIHEKLFRQSIVCGKQPKHLEEAGILRGFGLYRARVDDTPSPIIGFLFQDASDVLSLYTNGNYQGTVLPAGGSAYLANSQQTSNGLLDILVRAEIWGHSNFDDSRLPALR
jgi:beta-galactosidase